MARHRVTIVADLGFGDAGKGLLTDYLVRAHGAGLVVRYNGGAQAGHTVVAPDGRKHVFSQVGSGAFVSGVRTFLSRHVVVHPTALLREAAVLSEKGVGDALARLGISEQARIITPFHQALGRLRELARGVRRHGSCGVGVGEAVRCSLVAPSQAVRAGDLRDRERLAAKTLSVRRSLESVASRLTRSLRGDPAALAEAEAFQSDDILDGWVDDAASLASSAAIVSDRELATWMGEVRSIVFEGAQGVLLDEWCGFHPYTTWSRCTCENAEELLGELAPQATVEHVGVIRSHMVRHGPGPLPTETADLSGLVDEDNRAGVWQGPVRYGWFDCVLARYALKCVGQMDKLAITHMDLLERIESWLSCSEYRLPGRSGSDGSIVSQSGGETTVRSLPAEAAVRSLARQTRLTKLLSLAQPVCERFPPEPDLVVAAIERSLARDVALLAFGPASGDVVPA